MAKSYHTHRRSGSKINRAQVFGVANFRKSGWQVVTAWANGNCDFENGCIFCSCDVFVDAEGAGDGNFSPE